MIAQDRKALIAEIMNLNAPVTATGASAGGYLGIMSNGAQAVMDLKKVTAQFAEETQAAKLNHTKIDDLTNQIEAGLRTLNALNILDQKRLNSILDLLPE